jgi:hypothetical protein
VLQKSSLRCGVVEADIDLCGEPGGISVVIVGHAAWLRSPCRRSLTTLASRRLTKFPIGLPSSSARNAIAAFISGSISTVSLSRRFNLEPTLLKESP